MRSQHPSAFAPRLLEGAVPSRLAVFSSLHCPFHPLSNPNEEQAGAAASAWVRTRFGSSRAERLIAAGMERLTSGFYPTANLDRLIWVTKFLHWAFALDDLVDETAIGHGPRDVAQLFERFDQLMQFETLAAPSPLETAYAELLQELHTFLTPPQFQRFRVAMHAYFGAMMWEANNRAHRCVPDLESYELFRPAAGAVPPFWMLIEPLEGVSMTEVERHVGLREASELAGRIVCWYNDVLSYAKEYAAKDVHNLAIVLERHRYLSPTAAFHAAIEFCNDEVGRFVAIVQPLIQEHGGGPVAHHVRVLESMMATTLCWTMDSARYAASATPLSSRVNVA
jgi:5-epi-alpha-selinene synthase